MQINLSNDELEQAKQDAKVLLQAWETYREITPHVRERAKLMAYAANDVDSEFHNQARELLQKAIEVCNRPLN